jgi:hypothetical protein
MQVSNNIEFGELISEELGGRNKERVGKRWVVWMPFW